MLVLFLAILRLTEYILGLQLEPRTYDSRDTSVTALKSQVNGRPMSERVHIEEHQIPVFVLTGARMAQTFYKLLYPLTENL